jgi:hypothetical protein
MPFACAFAVCHSLLLRVHLGAGLAEGQLDGGRGPPNRGKRLGLGMFRYLCPGPHNRLTGGGMGFEPLVPPRGIHLSRRRRSTFPALLPPRPRVRILFPSAASHVAQCWRLAESGAPTESFPSRPEALPKDRVISVGSCCRRRKGYGASSKIHGRQSECLDCRQFVEARPPQQAARQERQPAANSCRYCRLQCLGIDNFEGKPLNSPNHIVPHQDGGI